jgi:hypothetical protein
LKGTSWLTSVWPLMMRLSAAFTRRCAALAAGACAVGKGAGAVEEGVDSSQVSMSVSKVGDYQSSASKRKARQPCVQGLAA